MYCDRLLEKTPSTHLIVCSVVRGLTSKDPLREKANTINARVKGWIEKHPTHDQLHYLDLASLFYDEDGKARGELVRSDGVHLTQEATGLGPRRWSRC